MNFKIDEYWNYWVLIKDFGFALDSSDVDLGNIDLLGSHIFRFVRYKYPRFFVSKTSIKCFQYMSSRHLQDMSSRYVFKTSSRHVFNTSLKRPQRNNFSSSKTSSRRLARCLQDVYKTSWRRLCKTFDIFKTSSRRIGRKKIFTLKMCWRHLQDMSWRRLQNVRKTNKCLLGNNSTVRW